ncbi:MAG: hypothetical protein KAW12_21210 [Candidatus Aminicenantes bacterium]|nr:hypothetical protein [Candidatus Aminicenantes bacterium]
MKRKKANSTKVTILKNRRSDIRVPEHVELIVRMLETGKAQKYRHRGIQRSDFVSPGSREVKKNGIF